jgi:hypothetical protein
MQELKLEEEYVHQNNNTYHSYSQEPRNFEEGSKDEYWIKAMDEELDQKEKNDTWEMVPRPKNKNVIDTKWVLRNKLNKDG